jgi:uncharacterized protein (TIGR03435 family)
MRDRDGRALSAWRNLLTAAVALTVLLVVGALTAPLLPAQAPAGQSPTTDDRRPAFDVASIKPSVISKAGGEGSWRSSIEHSPDSLTMRNVDLNDCVQWAYGVESYQISGPNSLGAKRYDILAKTADPVPVSQLKLMLQQLLADRFKLALHRDTKKLPVYELIVAKGGPRLPAAKTGGGSEAPLDPRVQDGNFVFADTSMMQFAEELSFLKGIDQPVLDQTGIKGIFDITLKGAATAMLQQDGPSLFTLVQEQLGLKLEAQTAPVDVFVIDHVEQPSPN